MGRSYTYLFCGYTLGRYSVFQVDQPQSAGEMEQKIFIACLSAKSSLPLLRFDRFRQ